jgi:uncharacterized membrane protein/uncharacterized membrane protein YeaQ/YmgE (transglycosylase-associated protein family)
MHVWLWFFTGLAVGACTHLVVSRRRFGPGGELALGALGAVLAGALARYGGLTPAGASLVHVAVALGGAVALRLVARTLAGPWPGTARAAAPAPPIDRAALLHQALVAGLSDAERHVLGKFLNRETAVRDVEREQQETQTFGERATDRIAAFGGSWAFLGLFGATLVAWMIFNVDAARPFDPFPFILLNLGLSCVAAIQAPIILMSQNRQAQKDRLNAAADYEVNMKAEMEILALHEKLDELREKAWRDLIELQQKQLEVLRRLEESAATR